MNDMQILTLALTMLGIFAASWFNNSRFGDTNNRIADLSNKLDSRINDTRDVLRAEMNVHFERMNSKLDAILMQLTNHDAPSLVSKSATPNYFFNTGAKYRYTVAATFSFPAAVGWILSCCINPVPLAATPCSRNGIKASLYCFAKST